MPAAPALLAPPPPSFPPLPPLSYKQLSQTMLYWMYTGVGHPWEPEKPRSQNLLEKECASFLLKLSVATNSSVTGGGARRVPHASMPRSLHLGQRVCLTWFCAGLFCDVTHTSIHPLKWTQDGSKKGLHHCGIAHTSIHPPLPPSEPRMDQSNVHLGELRSYYWRYWPKQKWRPKAAASAKGPPQWRWKLTKRQPSLKLSSWLSNRINSRSSTGQSPFPVVVYSFPKEPPVDPLSQTRDLSFSLYDPSHLAWNECFN